ncbi:MAG TPA: tetratricopeptide repeat protein [Anaerolineaceae bacterium]|nr:tetratricopeptide repeat protein [Anaerolineaceae bacterium]
MINVLKEFREKLPAQEARWVSTSLCTDPLVLASLQKVRILEDGSQFEPGSYKQWSPAALALQALGSSITPGELARDLSKSPDIDLLQMSLKFFQETRRSLRAPKTLAEAALLAISLRQHWRLDSTWKGLVNQLTISGNEPDATSIAVWSTAIACLYGMVPDPVDMLRGLFSRRLTVGSLSLATHAILSNPLSESEQVQAFYSLIFSLPPLQQISWLRFLKNKGKDGLVEELAHSILSKIPASTASALVDFNPDDWDLENLLLKSLELQRMAGLYRYGNQPANARSMLDKAQTALRHWSAGINLQLAELAYLSDQPAEADQYVKDSMEPLDNAAHLQQELMMILKGPQSESLLGRISQVSPDPMTQIFEAGALAHDRKINLATAMARQAVQQWMDQSSRLPEVALPNFAFDWQPRGAVQVLLDMGLLVEALQVLNTLLVVRPVDGELLELASTVAEQLGNLDQALSHSEILATLDNENPEKHRRLANLLAKKDDWQPAFDEYQRVIKLANPADVGDWTNQASAASHLGLWQEVQDSVAQALQIKPDNGFAYALLGQAKLQTGAMDEAGQLLQQATVITPDEPLGWLMLAEYYEKAGDSQKSLETLRAAVLAVPESADVNFKLARICLRQGLLSDGLPFIRKAASLSPESLDVSLELGQTLFSLGRLDEAYKVLSQAHEKWPFQPDLAFTFAQAAIAMGDRESAIPAMESALKKENPDPEWYVLFAETLIGDDPCSIEMPDLAQSYLSAADHALDMALEKMPDNFEARVLKAEVLSEKGDLEQAHSRYLALLDTPEANSPSVRSRLQAGLGKVSLKMGQVSNALASLQEALQNQSENIGLHHLLAEAFQAGDLVSEAMTAARTALKLAPDNLENLSWFAELMISMDEPLEAVHALNVATQLAPNCPKYWIRMANLYQTMGDLKSASDGLERLLEIKPLPEEVLRQAATIYFKAGELENAIHCFERAAEETISPSKAILVELAHLLWSDRRFASGLEIVLKAIENDPDDGYLYILQADLLTQLERYEAAIACLEHGLNQAKSSESKKSSFWQRLATSDFVDPAWIASICDLAQIHVRFAYLYRRTGNLQAALQHAELAYELKPESPEFALMVSDWAIAMNLKDRAAKAAAEFDYEKIDPNKMADPVRSAAVSLLAVSAEAFGETEVDQAQSLIEKGFEIDPQNARLEAAYACLLVKQGDWIKANEAFEIALEKATRSCIQAGSEWCFPDYWLGLAALETQHWAEALNLFREYVKKFSNEPFAHLGLGKVLANMAERQRLYAEVQCVHALPGEASLSDERYEEFERAVQNAARFGNAPEIETWRVRGRAAFRPTTQNLHALNDLLPDTDAAEILVAGLRRAENLAGAIQVGEQFKDTQSIQTQVALTYLHTDPETGLNIARLVVEKRPNQILGWITLALIAKKLGELSDAYAALKQALSFWPDEPLWQAWAAELAGVLEQKQECVDHWEAAVRLSPENFQFGMALGGAYLRNNQPFQAITALEAASRSNSNRSDLWYMLAQAYRQTNQFNVALQCAEKSSSLDPDSAQPVLLCGEIYLAMEEKEAALQCAQRAWTRDQSNEVSLLFYVKVLIKMDRSSEALAILDQAKDTLNSPRVQTERARLIYHLKGALVALPLLQQLANENPEDVEILAGLGHAQVDCNDFKAASKTITEALKLAPAHPELNYLMGSLQHGEGQLDNAVHFLSSAIQNDPEMLDAYLELARTYQERRETKEALDIFQAATKVAPKDYRAYYNAALMLRDGKDYLGAEALLRKAAELAPEDVNIRRQLGAVITLNLIHNSQEASTAHETYWNQDVRR